MKQCSPGIETAFSAGYAVETFASAEQYLARTSLKDIHVSF
jgi:hypothetical protein